MSASLSYKELGVMLVVAVVLLVLVNRVPPMIGAMSGGHIHALGNGFGTEAAVGAAVVGGAAIAAAGAALAAGATSIGGGAQALMAAFSKANASENGGGGIPGAGDLMAAAGGSGGADSGSGSALASAMGDSGGDLSTPGEAKSGGARTAGSMAAKVGRVAAGTVGNLAQGSWDVAKAKGGSMKGAVMDRVGETAGGKIAAAISARAAETRFDDNSLSAGSEKAVDAESEVASFRDKTA